MFKLSDKERERSRKYNLDRYYRLKKEAFSMLGDRCARCGKKRNLEIDHKIRSNKSFNVTMMLNVSRKLFLLEVKKCQLLCKKCHLTKTMKELGKEIAKGTHGTLSSYRYCHCEKCKKAQRDYMRKYRETHPRKKK